MLLRVSVLVVGLVLLSAAPASANTTLTYETGGGPLQLAAAEGTTLSLFQYVETSCPAGCDPRLDVRSSQTIVEAPDNNLCAAQSSDRFFQCRPLPADVTVTGSPAADSLTASGGGQVACPGPVVVFIGGGGPDVLLGACGDDRLDGGDGRDTLSGNEGSDTLDGGADADVLDGGSGNDRLGGGDGRDVLVGGPGADVMSGGPSFDTVSYETRVNPVSVTLGGVADDGEAGEGDTVGDDVEGVIGGQAGDFIVGSEAANDIDGGPGPDTIVPGGGADDVEGGPGDDVISARDGVPDRIVCGEGTDRVTADAFDSLDGCEIADVSRELMPDIDNDGLTAAQGDCNDRNPLIRAGFPDRPGDGIDQDCAGGDAAFPRVLTGVSSGWRFFPRHLRFTKLELVDVPDKATVELRCTGKRKGCFKGVKRRRSANGTARMKLTSLVRRSKLRPKAVLEVRIKRPDTIAKVVRYKIRKGKKDPQTRILCLRPGARSPQACGR